MSFFCPGIPSRTPHNICHLCVGSPRLCPPLRFFLFSMALTVLSSAGHVRCIMSLSWDLSNFPPLWLDQDSSFGRRTQGKVSFSSHCSIQGACYRHDVSRLVLTLTSCLRCCLSGFSMCSRCLPCAPHCPLWGRHYARYSPTGVRRLLLLFKAEVSVYIIWNSASWEIFLFSINLYILVFYSIFYLY